MLEHQEEQILSPSQQVSSANPKQELQIALASLLEKNPLLEQEQAQQRRHHVISVKVSPQEKERLEQRCQGIVMSDYIRARLFDYALPRSKPIMPQVNRETLYHLKRIGANINQQTLAIHNAVQTGQQPLTNEVNQYLEDLQTLQANINQLRQEMVSVYHEQLLISDELPDLKFEPDK
jgi:hypothetical protein